MVKTNTKITIEKKQELLREALGALETAECNLGLVFDNYEYAYMLPHLIDFITNIFDRRDILEKS